MSYKLQRYHEIHSVLLKTLQLSKRADQRIYCRRSAIFEEKFRNWQKSKILLKPPENNRLVMDSLKKGICCNVQSDADMSTFGAEFDQIWPKPGSALNFSEFGLEQLRKCESIKKPDAEDINIKEFMQKSADFPVEFGTNTCRVINQPKERHAFIVNHILSVYPLIHERVLALYIAFLEHKCKYGNQIELKVYKKMDIVDFVQRLLEKRCVSFVGPMDHYLLLNCTEGYGGFTDIGFKGEQMPLKLKHVLSYDEIKLSAFLSVSSHTDFLNDGNRYNAGKIEPDKSKIEQEGVIIGVIGGRFESVEEMEWQDIMITENQNTKQRGYGYTKREAEAADSRVVDYRQMWVNFYEEPDLRYDAVQNTKQSRFFKIPGTQFIFDNLMMKKRYTVSFDTLLLESQARGRVAAKQVYLHVVGFGLGVWRAVEHQSKIFLETFSQRMNALLPHLTRLAVVHFSYFGLTEWGDLVNDGMIRSDIHPNGGIRTMLSNRNPSEKLSPEFNNMLLVESYAWDANALPGNEFWVNKTLTSSGDPAAACSTLITELHNPHINTLFASGNNLHIASERYGVLHISEYAERILEN